MLSQPGVLWVASFHVKKHGSPSSLPAWGPRACGEVSSKGSPTASQPKTPPLLGPWAVGGQCLGSRWPEVPHSLRVDGCWQSPLALGPCLGSCHHPPNIMLGFLPSSTLGELSVTGSGVLAWDPATPSCCLSPQPSEFPAHLTPPPAINSDTTITPFSHWKTGFHCRQRSLQCGECEGGG